MVILRKKFFLAEIIFIAGIGKLKWRISDDNE
jgi:hypothetical protein